ncbi:hypothetical protein AKJ37_04085 [candidate division MSBL1 archaeon SCGC-AAA259I09]|uniref:Cysteine-rich domain-containing protein n=1 Tax=candidate division MSBL1 archaeon SCGC-AAA259I09 TaxID=1698267 RepID=A0A133US12_9EURY|nr:hypothetical protein AKJ37_04085 [candidate division MSBL1 archaeon SCGC-AAA259I09]
MMPREKRVDEIQVSDKMYLFRPCVGSNKYPGIISSALEVFPKLGIEPVTSEEQTCCGGFLTFTNVAKPTSTMPAVARNIDIAEEKDLDIVTFCNGCYTFLSEFSHFMNEKPEVKNVVNRILSMVDRDYEGKSSIYHALEILYKLKDRINDEVEKPLEGMKFATHYGCHYLNGFKNTAIDDPHMPTVMEELIETMGGEVVNYSENRTCCGTGLTQIITNKEEVALPHTKQKLDSLKDEADPDAVIVVCPYCQSQLDRMQHKFDYRDIREYDIPVMHLVQLVGLALGVEMKKLGLEAHAIGFDDFLEKFERESEGEKEVKESE